MEHAIIINRLKDLKRINPKYTRVYFGNDFCPRLLPEPTELEKAIKIIRDRGRNFTLLTPYADSEGLMKIKNLIKYLAKREILSEIVVNDLGVLYYIKREFPFFSINVGRILSRMGSFDYFIKRRIKRIEADFLSFNSRVFNLRNGLVKLSFYYPYSVIQGTRYCSMADLAKNKRENHGITRCAKECLKIGELKLKNSLFAPNIILRGNVQFIENKGDYLRIFSFRNVDRLVFQPAIRARNYCRQ